MQNRTSTLEENSPSVTPETLRDYPIRIEQPVVWGEIDHNGHVNNIWYFRYIENARVELYRRLGKYDDTLAHDTTLVVASTSCRFRKALVLGDIVVTGVKVDAIENDRFDTSYRIVRRADSVLVAEAEAKIVCVNSERQCKTALPGEVRRILERYR